MCPWVRFLSAALYVGRILMSSSFRFLYSFFFVLIFFTVLYLQTDPSRSYALVNQLKTTLMQTDAALVAEVRSVESLFKYFVGEIEEAADAAGLMPSCEAEDWD